MKITKLLLWWGFSIILRIFAYPIAVFILLLRPLIKIQFVSLFSKNVGHFTLNTELMLCAFGSEILKRNVFEKKIKYVFYTQPIISNAQLLRMWKRILFILPFPRLIGMVNHILCGFSFDYKNDLIKITVEPHLWGYDTHSLLTSTKPHLSFSKSEKTQGELFLEKLGLPKNAKYICLFVRDSAYDMQHFSISQAEAITSSRNANIDNYKKAALFLADKGYYVIRMGAIVTKSFDVSHSRIIDYANHPLKSDFLDVYLSAHCHFFMSTSSGLDGIAQVFRRPILLTNHEFIRDMQFWYPGYLAIFKHIKRKDNGKFLSLKERMKIFSEACGGKCKVLPYRTGSGYFIEKYKLELCENSEDEILAVTQEMEQRIDGIYEEKPSDKNLQEIFWEIFCSAFDDGDEIQVHLKIGESFLKTSEIYKDLRPCAAPLNCIDKRGMCNELE